MDVLNSNINFSILHTESYKKLKKHLSRQCFIIYI